MDNNEGFSPGDHVRVKDMPGEWVVRRVNDDGSICCYGGPVYRKAFRDFPVERLLRKDRK